MVELRSLQGELRSLQVELIHCRTCRRLVAWREEKAREKRASFREDDVSVPLFAGRPVAGNPQGERPSARRVWQPAG